MSEDVMSDSLTDLKNTLLALKAAGADGFEGFLRVVLTRLTGIPFRLAVSGLQGGMDGDSALRGDAVSFEAKRYSGAIHRNEVLTKIVDLARKSGAPDRLWILGATVEIGAQLATAVEEVGDQNAISTLILDWTAEPLPLLAVATAAAGDSAIDFLVTHCVPQPDRHELAKSIKEISEHPEFGCLLQRLRSDLNVSTLATARSTEANKEWRRSSFSSGHTARERLGQALAVTAQPTLLPLRATQRNQVKEYLQCGQSVILSGGEGHGKSWLAAQICCDHEGLAIFASAEQFEGIAPNELDKSLIELLIQQTGDMSDEAVRRRWGHRLVAWKSQPPSSPVLVIVDGINQRDRLRWDRILNSLQERLQAIGGRLIVSVRPQFWHKIVAPGLAFRPKLINVPVWSPDERDQLLGHYGISLDWLDEATLETLLNPRLLGVAVATLPHHSSTAWKGLTPDRILMEHLRASQRENFESETLSELTKRLSNHAKEVLERVRASPSEPPLRFEVDSTAVIETRFFRSLPGPGDTYELRMEGLTLALGYTLIDQLWKVQGSGLALSERMTHLIDPIHAMDRTVDVMFAALMVCALDPIRFDEAIFSVLLDAFSHLQNVSDQRFEEFVEISKNQPAEFFKTLGVITLERGRRLNQDWFTHAAFEIASSDDGWPVTELFIHRWMHCYNKDAVEQTNRYPRQNDEKDLERLQTAQRDIQDVLSCLSSFERDLLKKMTEVAGDTDDLFTLAIHLLAGRPLAGFSNSFVALGLGFALDRDTSSARKAFQQLTTFNRVDRDAAKAAYLNSIEPLRAPATSRSGQWTLVRMLYATGDEAAAIEAGTIAEKLRKHRPHWVWPANEGWRQLRVADPDATKPADMNSGLELFRAISPEKMMQSMGQVSEDYDLRELLPVICRFEPRIATEKAREILSGLLTRTAFPLRQLILNGTKYSPLMTRDLALRVVSRVTDSSADIVEDLAERERNFLRMCLFCYAAPQLTSSEQLACMTDPAFGTDYLLKVIPSLKPQPTEAIYDVLQAALDAHDDAATYGALAAARHGNTPVTPELESLLLRCERSESSVIRALSFEVSIECNLKMLRDFHARSSWSALEADITTYESWFGSVLLAEATSRKELSIHALLKRISPETWFIAAERVGDEMIKPLADSFLSRLRGAVRAAQSLEPLAVDFTVSVDSGLFPLLSIDETERLDGRFPRHKELPGMLGGEGFEENRARLRAIADVFLEKLKSTDAQLIIQNVTISDIKLLVRLDPTILPQMLEILECASATELAWLRSVAFIVANIASTISSERATALFQRTLAIQGIVTHDRGDGLTLEHEAIWSSAASQKMELLWRDRLLQCGNDEILAQEVLAAERFGSVDFIRSFVEQQSRSASTLDQAYAIGVAGYSLQSEQLLGIIESHMGDSGITGEAAKKAKAAHEAAQWGRKWVRDMCAAQSPEEFWGCLIIAKTCIDARITTESIQGTRWAPYAPLLRSVRSEAIKEQGKSREKILLGQAAPEGIFITGYGNK
ncbi:hypothetical protein [Stutzerimonas chloritidismutans]|uniref:hypothetical protein n=1 Tax=Stutzerimonas chloritidismutans TaxID=203192 RepID=UPI001D194809|nr:hypothetical protein [Stutzerimonas chloritidismutans]UEG63301.1 hypothetical protein LLJ08_09270 [Stutzerimonas chloritidismutans]